jgi:hypothetical protein
MQIYRLYKQCVELPNSKDPELIFLRVVVLRERRK